MLIVNPSNDEIIADIHEHTVEEIEAKFVKAQFAQKHWHKKPTFRKQELKGYPWVCAYHGTDEQPN